MQKYKQHSQQIWGVRVMFLKFVSEFLKKISCYLNLKI